MRLGRPPEIAEDVVERIREEREAGASMRAIADGLNRQGVPTPARSTMACVDRAGRFGKSGLDFPPLGD